MGVSRNSRGFSVMGALIGIGIFGVVSTGLMQMITYYNRSTTALEQKMETIAIQQTLMTALTSDQTCGCNLNTQSFNTNNNSAEIDLDGIYACNPAGTGVQTNRPFVALGEPSSTRTVKVSQMTLSQFAGGSGTYSANLTISFDPSSMVVARKPVTVPINLTATDTNPAIITGCSVGGNGGGPGTGPGGTVTSSDLGYKKVSKRCRNRNDCTVHCPRGKTVMSCGCQGSSKITFFGPYGDSCKCEVNTSTTVVYRVNAICINK